MGRVFGIPLGVSYSWFIIFGLVTVSLALQFPQSWPAETRWTAALVTSVLFFGSVVGHELAHSVVAMAYGISVKGITLFIFGGVAQIAREATKPWVEVLVAAAGPLSSLVFAGLFYLMQQLAADLNGPIVAMAGWLALINLNLAIFNMVPGFPLDGGRVLRAILWWVRGDYRSATRTAVTVGRVFAWAFIVAGAVSALGAPVVHQVTGVRIGFIGGLWLAFIGWFLDNAATSTYAQMVLRESLAGYTARDLMARDLPLVSRYTTLRHIVDDNLVAQGKRFLLVGANGVLDGILTLRNIKAVPKEHWDRTLCGDVMTPIDKMTFVSPQTDAYSVLEKMDEADVNQMPIVDGDVIVGIVDRERLAHIVRVRSELK